MKIKVCSFSFFSVLFLAFVEAVFFNFSAHAKEGEVQKTKTPQPVISQPVSEAEKLLFMGLHMKKGVKVPSTLLYSFERKGSLETDKNFKDKASVQVEHSTKGEKRVVATVEMLSGANRFNIPRIPGVSGNPIILAYLEREIAEMSRLSGGSTYYFRKRIRMSLADDAVVKPIQFELNGKKVNGREISFSPYENDPLKARYEKFSTKRYAFILSEQVPGKVYQMRSVLTDSSNKESGDSQPLLSDTLVFKQVSLTKK